MFQRVPGGIARMRCSTVFRAASAVVAVAALAGCVERKMVIRSDPPGALITLDGNDTELRTPAEIPFDFGGTRAVVLAAPGHRVVESTAKLSDPWFTYFPLDIGAEFLWPGTIEDVQTFDYKLEPYGSLTPDLREQAKKRLAELKLRAAQFRAGGSEGPAAAPPAETSPSTESAPKK
jgi:hypothetical protein